MNREKLKKGLIYTAGILASLVLVFFLLRNVIFSFYLDHKINRFNKKYHADLKVEKAKISYISTVMLTGISLKPEKGDTLLVIDTASASLNLRKIFTGHIVVRNLVLGKTCLSVIQDDTLNNIRFLLNGRKQKNKSDSIEKRNYAITLSRLASALFEKIPATLKISDLTVSHQKDGHKVSFHVDHFAADHNAFHTLVNVTEGDTIKNWIIAGSLDKQKHSAGFRLYSSDNEKLSVPFIGYDFKTAVTFDTLTFRLWEEDKGDDLFHYRGITSFRGLVIQQEKISANNVAFDRLGMEYAINVGSDYFEMDSSTQIFFNRLSFHPYLRYRPKPTKQITFSIVKPDFPAEELFSSLPSGLFSTLKGIRVNGNLAFTLKFYVDLSLPDSLQFRSELKRNRFSVLSYGDADLTRLNEYFEYTAYEKGQPYRTFTVGPENPEFRPLNKISPFLQISVLNSEDAGFYLHRGFIPDAIRESLIQDIKERRFARGGSTITMQLVKNVFLNRNKTISRKLEEILLVWLIENQELCPKERMFEVYLNIIELGPHIYGANEAAHFYFNKDASKLTLEESIFIASIIPRPKWFMYSFDETGHIRQSEKDFLHLLSGKMLNKGQINQEEYDKLDPDITLKGPAKLLLKTKEPMPADSLEQFNDQGL
jgi:hypothetical protein